MKQIFIFLFISLTIISCNRTKQVNLDLSSNVISVLNHMDNIIAYGNVDIKKITDEGGLENIEVVSNLLEEYLPTLEEGLDLSQKLYYLIEKENNSSDLQPEQIYIILKIKNVEKLKGVLSDIGFSFENKNGIEFSSAKELHLAFNEEILVGVYSRNNQSDNEQKLTSILKTSNRPNDKITESLFDSKSDVLLIAETNVLGEKLTNILPRLPEEEKDKWLEKGKLIFNFDFEKGNLNGQIDLTHLNQELRKVFILKDKFSDDYFDYIKTDSVNLALKLDFDTQRLDELIKNYSKYEKGFLRSFGIAGMVLEAIVGDSISGITSGNIGLVVDASEAVSILDTDLPSFNFYLGLGVNTQKIQEAFSALKQSRMVGEPIKDVYTYNNLAFKLSDTSLFFYSNKHKASDYLQSSKKPIPKKEIQEPLYFYMNFQANPIEYPIDDLPKDVLDFLKDFELKGNNDLMTFKIKSLNQEEHFLKQVINNLSHNYPKVLYEQP